MRVIHHNHSVVLVSEIANAGEFGNVAIHRKNAVRRDKAVPRSTGFLEFRFKVRHVTVFVSEAGGFTEPDAINDAGMIQLVRYDCVFLIEQRFKKTAVGVKARAIENRIFGAEELTETSL